MKFYQTLAGLFFLCIGIAIGDYTIDGIAHPSVLFSKCFFTYAGGIYIHIMWYINHNK